MTTGIESKVIDRAGRVRLAIQTLFQVPRFVETSYVHRSSTIGKSVGFRMSSFNTYSPALGPSETLSSESTRTSGVAVHPSRMLGSIKRTRSLATIRAIYTLVGIGWVECIRSFDEISQSPLALLPHSPFFMHVSAYSHPYSILLHSLRNPQL